MTAPAIAILAYTAGCVIGLLIGAVAVAVYERTQRQIAADERAELINGVADWADEEDARGGALR